MRRDHIAKKIVIVGSINLDLVASVARMPLEGETLTGNDFATFPGGKGANQAVGVARLGGDAVLIGRLGNDSFADTLEDGLSAAGVRLHCINRVDTSSGIALITVSHGGGNSIVVIPGANAALKPGDLDLYLNEFRGAAIVLAQLEVPLDVVVHAARLAAKYHVPFVLDPAPMVPLPSELLRLVTWLTPNEAETRSLLQQGNSAEASDLTALEDKATKILGMGVRNVALKLGERGTYLAGKDVQAGLVQPFVVEALDTTAAGDAFNAGFAYALTERLSGREAARFANAVAAVSVTRRGAQSSMPSLGEVDEFLTMHS